MKRAVLLRLKLTSNDFKRVQHLIGLATPAPAKPPPAHLRIRAGLRVDFLLLADALVELRFPVLHTMHCSGMLHHRSSLVDFLGPFFDIAPRRVLYVCIYI